MIQISDGINRILSEIFTGRIKPDDIHEDLLLFEDLKAKPGELLEILLSLSAVYGVDVNPEDPTKFQKVGDIYSLFIPSEIVCS